VIREDLIRDEGFVPHVYKDHLGFDTLGYGFLVDQRRGGGIPQEVANFWLDYLIAQNYVELVRRAPWIAVQPEPVKRALQNMAYQLGINGLLNFQRTMAAIQSGDYKLAADHALNSRWAQQTPARAKRIADLIRSAA
jgi:lysozyme